MIIFLDTLVRIKCIIKMNLTGFFILFLMWELANFKFHVWHVFVAHSISVGQHWSGW